MTSKSPQDIFARGDHLQEDFDVNSLTMPAIRGLLTLCDIEFPSGLSKAGLVQTFNDEVYSKRAKLLRKRDKIRRKSEGITDADRYDEGGELIPPPPRVRSSRTPSRRLVSEEVALETPARRKSRSSSPRKKAPSSVAGKHPRASETESSEVEPRRTVRKTRRSETPVVKEEQYSDEEQAHGHERVFSSENPFQQGSSPLASSKIPSGDARRRTTNDTPAKRKSTSKRRTTEVKQSKSDGGIKPPSRSTFSAEIPVSTLDELVDFDDHGVEIGEEFTPEGEQEVLEEVATRPKNAIVRRPRKKQKRSATPFWVVLFTMFGGYAAWYRQEKLAVGYCGVGRPATSVISAITNKVDTDDLPQWAVAVAEPQCEPCPQHAYCYENLETSCEPDFVLQPHPLSLGGLIPIPPTCEPDGEKVRRIKTVADRAVEYLRELRAKYECGMAEIVEGMRVPVKQPDIDQAELKQKVGEKRRRGMSESEFEDLWEGAIGEIQGREEVDVEHVRDQTTDNIHTHLSSSSLADIPLSCALKRSFRLTLERYRFHAGLLILSLILSLYARLQYSSYVETKKAIPDLVKTTLDRLALQATRHATDPESFRENYISISQLRDDVLRDEHSLQKRNAIWQKVRQVVEMNANVRSAQRQDRNGEIARVWEWIGAVGEIEDTPGRQFERSVRRKSGRVSWHEGEDEGPLAVEEGGPSGAKSPVSGTDCGEELVRQKWQDSRPIY